MPDLNPDQFPTNASVRKIALTAADPEVYGKDAWHVMDWTGEVHGTYGGRRNAEDRLASRKRTVKGMITKQAKKRT